MKSHIFFKLVNYFVLLNSYTFLCSEVCFIHQKFTSSVNLQIKCKAVCDLQINIAVGMTTYHILYTTFLLKKNGIYCYFTCG